MYSQYIVDVDCITDNITTYKLGYYISFKNFELLVLYNTRFGLW